MAATVDAFLGNGNGSTVAPNITTAADAAVGSTIIAWHGSFTGGVAQTHSLPTATGVTFALLHSFASGNIRVSVWIGHATSGLVAGSTITFGGSATASSDSISGARSFLGCDTSTTTPLAQNAAAATATNWSSGNMAGGAGNLMVAACFEDGSGTATSSPTSGTEGQDFAVSGQAEAETMVYTLSSAATDVGSGTWSASVSHVAVGAIVKVAAATAAAVALPQARLPRFLGPRAVGPLFFANPRPAGGTITTAPAPVTARHRRTTMGVGR